MNLSANFTLDELTVSETAARRGIDNSAPAHVIPDLMRLARDVLQPLRDHLGRPVVVTSGYRSRATNSAVGGALNSDHVAGRAADIIVPGMTPREVCRAVNDLALPTRQVIQEFGRWCHVSIPIDGQAPERELLTASLGPGGGVQYRRGLV